MKYIKCNVCNNPVLIADVNWCIDNGKMACMCPICQGINCLDLDHTFEVIK